MLKNSKKFFFFIASVIFIYILDRYMKYLSDFVYGCFILCMKKSVNYAAAFNLLQGFQWTYILLIVVGFIVLLLCSFFYFRIEGIGNLHFGLIFLFAGTLANLTDRLFYGYVIDWLTFSFMPFPSFNLADLSNFIGVIILIVYLIKKK